MTGTLVVRSPRFPPPGTSGCSGCSGRVSERAALSRRILRLDPARSVARETHSYEDRGSQIAICIPIASLFWLFPVDGTARGETRPQSAHEMTRGKRAGQYIYGDALVLATNQFVWQCSRSRYGSLVYIDSSVISFADAIIPND